MALPKYVQAAALIRAQIYDGALVAGEAAPSGAALARVTGYSVLTCRRALRTLIKDGLLVAGAVRHGPGMGRLVVQAADGELRCQVSDAGPGPALWPLRPGHGLWIAHQVADKVTVSSGPAGFRVTAVFAS